MVLPEDELEGKADIVRRSVNMPDVRALRTALAARGDLGLYSLPAIGLGRSSQGNELRVESRQK